MDRDIAGGATLGPTLSEGHDLDAMANGMAESARSSGAPLDAAEAVGRNSIFGQLVKSDTDINGLVAYSIYKQNKLDWLAAFETAKKRPPNEAELASYIIGEGTPRRLATYRHLADSTLTGQGPTNGEARSPAHRVGTPLLTPRSLAAYAIGAILFVGAFWLAAHVALAGR